MSMAGGFVVVGWEEAYGGAAEGIKVGILTR